jgi:hypothetical protein
VAYQKVYRTVVPVPRDQSVDDAVTVWLVRESFERTAESNALVLTSFTDLGEVAAEDIPPKAEKQLGRPATAFVWRSFEGVAERAQVDA